MNLVSLPRLNELRFPADPQPIRFRDNMVKVAALALAAIEAHDRGYC